MLYKCKQYQFLPKPLKIGFWQQILLTDLVNINVNKTTKTNLFSKLFDKYIWAYKCTNVFLHTNVRICIKK